ncbi:hypothetical protein Tco_0411937 [Tanacetum coccineum]
MCLDGCQNRHYFEALISTYLANEKNVDVEVDMGREFWFDELIDVKDVAKLEHFSSLQELNRKVLTRADELMMMNNAPALFGSTLNNNTLTQGLNVLQGLQRQRLNVMQGLQGPNVLSSQGLNVFDNARKYYNGQYFFDPALTMNASLQDQGGSNYNFGVGGELRKF